MLAAILGLPGGLGWFTPGLEDLAALAPHSQAAVLGCPCGQGMSSRAPPGAHPSSAPRRGLLSQVPHYLPGRGCSRVTWVSTPSPLFLAPTFLQYTLLGRVFVDFGLERRNEAQFSALRAYPCPTGRTGGPWACVPTPGPPSPAPGAAAHQGVGRWRRFGDVSVAQVAEPRDEEARREQEGA